MPYRAVPCRGAFHHPPGAISSEARPLCRPHGHPVTSPCRAAPFFLSHFAYSRFSTKGVLRNDEAKATRKAKRKAMKEKEDSDDDTFYDRTGEVEAKRKRKAMRKAALVSETYESLCAKKITATAELREIQQKLSDAKKKVQEIQDNSGLDPLDAFVSGLTNNLGDETMARMKRRQRELQIELNEYEKLLTLVTPAIKI
jgi:hypothetical protein